MEKIDGIIADIDNKKFFVGTVSFQDGKIVSIQQTGSSYYISPAEKLPFILPGFIDSHVHLEMTQLSPAEYARASLSQGVVGALVDVHDLACIGGRIAVEKIIDNSKEVPFYFGFGAPSEFNENYSLSDMEELLKKEEVTHVGEIQDFPSVILGEPYVQSIYSLAAKYNKPIDGYAPGITGKSLEDYCKSPVSTDNAFCSTENAIEKIQHGLKFQLQTRDAVDFLGRSELFDDYSEKMMLCSDKIYSTNIARGYINKSVAKSVRANHNVFNVLQAACITPVKHYGLKSGTLHAGDSADFILVDNCSDFNVLKTYIGGRCVYDNLNLKSEGYQLLSLASVPPVCNKLDLGFSLKVDSVKPEQIAVKTSLSKIAPVNVIDLSSDEIRGTFRQEEMSVKNGLIDIDVTKDLLKVVAVNRNDSSKLAAGFVHGFGFKNGAFATTFTHGSHDIVAVGTSDEDIIQALNTVISIGGGMCVVRDKKTVVNVVLEQGGVLTGRPAEMTAIQMNILISSIKIELNPAIRHTVRAVTYITESSTPTARISHQGLYNVASQEFVPVVME